MESIILKALNYAIDKHENQLRKGTDIPYIKHIIDVYNILRRNKEKSISIVIGILHDTIEDTSATEYEIKKLFGKKICNGVMIETEDKTITQYGKRKREHMERVFKAPEYIQVVNCADKLANITDMINDYKIIGEKFWERFKASKHEILEYYLYSINGYDLKDNNILKELKKKYKKLSML